jgi:hypothetical protein
MIHPTKTNRDRDGHLAKLWALLALGCLAVAPALAGSMPLEWNPVVDPDVAGYKVYYGTTAGTYTGFVDMGNVTVGTLGSLTDCSRYHIAVKAYDGSGNLSTTFSDEVVGLPTPTAVLLSPSTSERAQTLTVTVTGSNFDTGATASFLDPKITVTGTTLLSCTQLRVTMTIAPDATLGARALEVTNPDGSFVNRPAAFQVTNVTPPVVSSTNPPDGATNVPTATPPAVTFSEAVGASSVTASTVVLLASDGTPVAQAAGSPSLDATGTMATIVPAAPLTPGATYRLRVIGGASGVKDVSGTAMVATFTQATGFTLKSAPGKVTNLRRKDRH